MSPAHRVRHSPPAPPRFCYICCGPALPRCKYCKTCRRLVWHYDKLAKAKALKAAWDPIAKGFRCYYTGVLLELKDLSSPWYITFDHRIPGKKGDLVVCAAWVNVMKNQLSEEEFRAVIIEFARCKQAGEPFNMAVAEFKYWRGPPAEKLYRLPTSIYRSYPKEGICCVCAVKSKPYSRFCHSCLFMLMGGHMVKYRLTTLQNSWDPVRKCFICYLTGLKLDLVDRTNPLYRSFEHRIPGRPETQKMAAFFANVVKSALSEDEFWLVVKELAHRFQTGDAFNKDIVKFAYWKGWYRAKMRAMKARRVKARARLT